MVSEVVIDTDYKFFPTRQNGRRTILKDNIIENENFHVFKNLLNSNIFYRVNQKRPFRNLRTFLLIFANLWVFNKLSKIKTSTNWFLNFWWHFDRHNVWCVLWNDKKTFFKVPVQRTLKNVFFVILNHTSNIMTNKMSQKVEEPIGRSFYFWKFLENS